MEDDPGLFRYPVDSAHRFLRTFYGIQATEIEPLPGYDDTNFHIVAGPAHYLLKLTPCDSRYSEYIRMQVGITVYLKSREVSDFIAGVVRTSQGEVMAIDDMGWVGRVLEWIDGALLGEMTTVTQTEWWEVGVAIARFTTSIREFTVTDPSALSPSIISMETALDTIQARIAIIPNTRDAVLLQFFVSLYQTYVTPVLDILPRQIVHNDLHEYNVIMRGGKVAGIIDFEDVAESYRVIDLATMAGATFQDGDDVLSKITPLVLGFHKTCPLHEAEITALLGFMAIRLCIFVAFAAVQRIERPGEPYLYIGDELDWKRLYTLQKLDYLSFAAGLKKAINSNELRL